MGCVPDKTTTDPTTNSAFCLSDSVFKALRLDTVRQGPIEQELKLSGKITYDEDHVVKVFPVVSGLLEKVNVELGDHVTKGQILAVMRSSDVVEVESQIINARSNYTLALKNLDIAKDLKQNGLSSERDVVQAQREVAMAKVELDRAEEVSKIYGLHSFNQYQIRAPSSGYVVEKAVAEGMQFDKANMAHLFMISDLKDVWNIANVYESDVSKVTTQMPAEVTTTAYGTEVFPCLIDKVFVALDPESRVMKVRMKLNNSAGRLKPEMFTMTKVRTAIMPDAPLVCYIPTDDVIFDNNKYWVLAYKDRCKVELRAVEVASSQGDKTFIKSGLSAGERVIKTDKLLVYRALSGS